MKIYRASGYCTKPIIHLGFWNGLVDSRTVLVTRFRVQFRSRFLMDTCQQEDHINGSDDWGCVCGKNEIELKHAA